MKNILLRWGPALALMIIIFIFSAQPKGALPDYGDYELEVKKGAHVVAYACLAVLWLRGVKGEAEARLSHYLWAFAFTVLYAISDEYHQTFVAGRTGRWYDVVFDAFGATISLSLMSLWLRLRPHLLAPSPNKSALDHR